MKNDNDARGGEMWLIKQLVPSNIFGRWRRLEKISAQELVKALSGTLLFDENGEIIWFEVQRGGKIINIWRGYDPDHKEKERKAMRTMLAYARSKKWSVFPGVSPEMVASMLGLPVAHRPKTKKATGRAGKLLKKRPPLTE